LMLGEKVFRNTLTSREKRERQKYIVRYCIIYVSDNNISLITQWVMRLAVHKVDVVRIINEETVCLKLKLIGI